MRQVIVSTILGLATAAQLPSATYLPQRSESGSNNLGGLNGQGSGNTRPQQAVERNSAILKLDQEIGENGKINTVLKLIYISGFLYNLRVDGLLNCLFEKQSNRKTTC